MLGLQTYQCQIFVVYLMDTNKDILGVVVFFLFVCLFVFAFPIFILFTVFLEQGMDLLAQLDLLTNMQFSCPTGITGSFPRGLYANDSTEATYKDPIKLMSFPGDLVA